MAKQKSKLAPKISPPQTKGQLSHPIVFQGQNITVYSVNRQLLCSHYEVGASAELKSSCEHRSKGLCPKKMIEECGAFYYKNVPAKMFIDTLSDSDDSKLKAILAMLDLKKGQFSNEEKFKRIAGLESDGQTFYEIKSYQLRIGCFWQKGLKLYLTHGWVKKSQKADPSELKKITTIYSEFIKK